MFYKDIKLDVMENIKNNFEELKNLLLAAVQVLEKTNDAFEERISALEKSVDMLEKDAIARERRIAELEENIVLFSNPTEMYNNINLPENEIDLDERPVIDDVLADEDDVEEKVEVEEEMEVAGDEAEEVLDVVTEEVAEEDLEEEAEETYEEEESVSDEEAMAAEETMAAEEMVEEVPEEKNVMTEDDVASEEEDVVIEIEEEMESEEYDEPWSVVDEVEDEEVPSGEEIKIINEVARPDWFDWEVDYPASYIDDIYKGISFNDRYEFVKELFNVTGNLGEAEMIFKETLDDINEMDTFKDVVAYCRKRFPQWDELSDEVYRFYMIVRRKFNINE